MIQINSNEMYEIIGGINITATLVNALGRVANTLLEAGRALGSALRRLSTRDICTYK